MSLRSALLLLVVLVLAAGLLPAGALLDRRLGDALVQRTRDDLTRAPMVLSDRLDAMRQVRMMHAREIAQMPGLASALAAADVERAHRLVSAAAADFQEAPVLVDRTGSALLGPGELPDDLVEATRRGEAPVVVVPIGEELHLLALAPVTDGGPWMGAAGGATPFADAEAGLLAGLTRADVLVANERGAVVGSTLSDAGAERVAGALEATAGRAGAEAGGGAPGGDAPVRMLTVGERTLFVAEAPLDHGSVYFVRDLDEELAVLPELRRTALATTGLALAFALAVGMIFADRISRPVSGLADAVEGFGEGRSDAPLPRSSIGEVRRLSEAFEAMRAALEARLRELEDRQERLSLLQAELVQRERLAASGRLLAQLAHEIRNPVASVRNCLEVVRRKGRLEGEAAEFADMAVDELLRMHELAERMLDLHRPRSTDDREAPVADVARETAQLVQAGAPPAAGPVPVVGGEDLRARITPDALKQVLLNLLLNAREASPPETPVEVLIAGHDGRVTIDVLDRGPGIPPDALPRMFDPFFTTKDDVRGVGLGLYTAEGLVRAAGGTLRAANRADGPGARFAIELPSVERPDGEDEHEKPLEAGEHRADEVST